VTQQPIYSVARQTLGCGRECDNSSCPSETSSQWPSQARCINGSYFKNYCAMYTSSFYGKQPVKIALNHIIRSTLT
jgi:hypothetical protein